MKVALLEIGGSHDECLYSQVLFLKSLKGLQLTLICNERLRRNVEYFEEVDRYKYLRLDRRGVFQWVQIYRLWRFLRREKFDQIILNTAQGGMVKKLMLFPFGKQQRLSGTLHNISKLNGSSGQRIISSKLDQYFVLNDYLLQNLDDDVIERNNVGLYYPIFFPDYPIKAFPKEEDEIWICIPGQVEFKRRDYKGLLRFLASGVIPKHIRFLLLGRCEHAHGNGSQVKSMIKKMGLEEQFMMWDGFIDPIEFYNRIRHSDYIMPLIHTGHESYNLYSEQISGAFNLGFGYRKPFLMEDSFQHYSDFKENSLFYNKNTFLDLMRTLHKPSNSSYYQNNKWSFDYHKELYLSQLFLSSSV